MKPIELLPPFHGWPVFERGHRFTLGRMLNPTLIGEAVTETGPGVGRWQCELARNALTWSDEVYDIFGLPRGKRVSRDEAVACYCEHSRAVMEGLRANAIRTKLGFVLDAEIRPRHERRRWMRLIAMPILENEVVVRLHGLKQAI